MAKIWKSAWILLALLASSARGEESKDDVWQAEALPSFGATASVNGRVTHGDRFRLYLPKDGCESAFILLTFYTTKPAAALADLAKREIPLLYNGKAGKSQVERIRKFGSHHLVLMDLGAIAVKDFLIQHEGAEKITITLIDGENFSADRYFDIPQNEWSLAGLKEALRQAQDYCRQVR